MPGFKHSHDWCFELARNFATAPTKSPEHVCMKAGIAEDNYDGCFEYIFSDCLANAVTGTCVPWLQAHPPTPATPPSVTLPEIPITPGDTWGDGAPPGQPPATQPASAGSSSSTTPWIIGAGAIVLAGVAAWLANRPVEPAARRGARSNPALRPIDLRSLHLGTTPIFTSATKVEAIKFARKLGWPAQSAHRAANRFSMFWVVGQVIGAETLRLLKDDGSWIDIPWPGYW